MSNQLPIRPFYASSKKSVIYVPIYSPALPHSSTLSSTLLNRKKQQTKPMLLSLLEESRVSDFEELLDRSELLNEEQMQKLLTLILKKDPEVRTSNEIQFLEKKMHNFAFFKQIQQKIPPEYYLELFKELRFEAHQKNSTVFLFGDIGKKMFIILKGSVFVLVPKIKVQKTDDFLLKKFDNLTNSLRKGETFLFEDEGTQSGGCEQKPQQKQYFFNQEQEDEQKILEKYPNFRIVNTLSKGALFGEISLTLKEPRTATVVCKEDSSFCILKSATFEKILKTNYDKEFNFLQNLALFRGMSLPNIAILKGYLQENVYNKHFMIFRPGDESDQIYIVKEGEVEIYKSIETNPREGEYETKLQYSLINYAKDKVLNVKKTTNLIRNLTVGQTFGEEDIFVKQRRSTFAIVNSSKARILVLKKEDLFQNLKSLQIIKNIEQAFSFKIRWQQNKIQSSMRTRQENDSSGKLSSSQKTEKLSNQMKSDEGKRNLLKNLTLRSVRSRESMIFNNEENAACFNSYNLRNDGNKIMRPHKSSKSTHCIQPLNLTGVQKFQEVIHSERRANSPINDKGELNIEISPILKMCACSQLDKKRKRNSPSNMKVLLQNYEKELRKKIVFQVCKVNSTIETRKAQRKLSCKVEDKNNSNEDKLTRMCSSLRISEEVKKRFLVGLKKDPEA